MKKLLLLSFLVLFLAASGISRANNSNKQAREAEAADTAEVIQPKYTGKMLMSQCRKAYPKGKIIAALPVVCAEGTEYGVCVVWYADDEDYCMQDPFCRMVTLKDGRVYSNKIVPLGDSDFDSHSKETKPIIVKIGNADYLYFGYQNWLSGNALPGYAEYVFSMYDFVHNKIYTHSIVGTNEFNGKNEVVRFKIETDHPMITSS